MKSGNNTVQYTYDAKRRVKSVSLNGTENYVTYSYSGANNENVVASMNNGGYVVTGFQDAYGNVNTVVREDITRDENGDVRAFHGLEDRVVSPSQTREMVEALQGKHPDLKYDFYEGVGHDSWKLAFSEETLAWMLAQKKAE